MSIKPDFCPTATTKYKLNIIGRLLPSTTRMSYVRPLLQIAMQFDFLIHHKKVRGAY